MAALQVVARPQISPSGTRILYERISVAPGTDLPRSDLWLLDVGTGESRRLDAEPGETAQAVWSPDESRIAYVSTEPSGVQRVRIVSSSGQKLRGIDGFLEPHALAWSPDGKHLAFAATRLAAPQADAGPPSPGSVSAFGEFPFRTDHRGYSAPQPQHVFILSEGDGSPREASATAHFEIDGTSWSPDSAHILFSARASRDGIVPRYLASDIHDIDVAARQERQLTQGKGPKDLPRVSPDGRTIAYVGFDDRDVVYQNNRIFLMDREGGRRRDLAGAQDISLEQPVWSQDGKSILALASVRGRYRLMRFDLSGGHKLVAERLSGTTLDRPYIEAASYSAARDGTLAIPLGTPERPAELAIVRNGRTRQLTDLNGPLLGTRRLAATRELETRSSFDARPLDVWLTLPPGPPPEKGYPLILEIHGGPGAAYGPYFATDYQIYAAAGYAVVTTNQRGSSGYGEEFGNLVFADYPNHDADDLLDAVAAAQETGLIDRDRTFVAGGSAGGMLAAWLVGKTNAFRAAAVMKPTTNWFSMALYTDDAYYYQTHLLGGAPWEVAESYWSHSPISLLPHVKTPTLIVAGTSDYRTPQGDAEQFYTGLKLRGVPARLMYLHGASHEGFSLRPGQNAARLTAILEWFAQYDKAR